VVSTTWQSEWYVTSARATDDAARAIDETTSTPIQDAPRQTRSVAR
jgi:hypothetical protein